MRKHSVDGRLVHTLDDYDDATGTYFTQADRVGNIVTTLAGDPFVDDKGQIDRCSRQHARVTLVSRTDAGDLVLVRNVPVPGTMRRKENYVYP